MSLQDLRCNSQQEKTNLQHDAFILCLIENDSLCFSASDSGTNTQPFPLVLLQQDVNTFSPLEAAKQAVFKL